MKASRANMILLLNSFGIEALKSDRTKLGRLFIVE